jgi:putative ABC transport system permease protein
MTGSEILNAVRMALATVREHKMRSLLTVLGVIIGTGTVIAVGSIITGVDGAVVNVMRSMGPETGFVFKFAVGFRTGRISREEMARKPLQWEDALAIRDRCPSMEAASAYLLPPSFLRGGMQDRARYKSNDVYNLDFAGTDESYMSGGNEKMKLGRFFTDGESQHRQPVVVIGEDLQKALFASEDPLNKWIDVDGHQFEVLGVLERPSASFPGQEDRRVLLPYFTMRKMFPTAKENMLVFVAKPGKLAVAIDEVAMVLRQQRRVPLNKPDDFWISTGQQMVDQFRNITSMVALVLVVLSSIGLLVGGIGVMNIMLVSVTERTREIGIRKAVGAKRSDIIAQFLTEAVVLTVLGGLLGMVFGWLISLLSRIFFPSLPTAVPLWTVVMGLAVSVGVGLFFGVWPATKAASLDPVDALRYE